MSTPALILIAVLIALTAALIAANFERIVEWFAGRFLPELDDEELKRSIDEWNRRHHRSTK